MPTVDVAKIKLRRGSNSDRKLVTLDEGELGYTTDTNRVYVGNGTTFGGSPTSVYNFGSDQRTDGLVQQKAELGDLIFDSNSFGATLLYTLTGVAAAGDAAWMQLSPQVDKSTIEYNAAGKLALASGATVTGGDSITVTANKVSVDYDGADTNTTTFFDIAGTDSGQLKVKNNALTVNSHGGLGFEIPGPGTLLHTLAIATDDTDGPADGFMSRAYANKCYYAPDWSGTGTPGVGKNADPAISDQGAGNRTISFINVGTQQINGARVNFTTSTITSTVQSSNALKKVVGQSSTTSNISAVDMMTPNNFFNREDFPGTVMRTAIPNANIDNIGNYANFSITNVAFPALSWSDKAFLLPGGNGVIYGVFVQNTGDFFLLEELYPQVTWVSATYDTDGATIRTNIIAAINSFTNSNGERIFDAWQKLDNLSSTVYIQGLVKGKTPTYGAAFAQDNLAVTYQVILDGSAADSVWANEATSIDYAGTVGDNAGANSSGKIGTGMYGWVNLNAQDSSTFQQTLCCTGFKARHTVAQFPAAADCTNGEYFLIYDTNWNRTCVYYFQTGSGSIVVPDISTNPTHRGRRTEMIMVEYPELTGGLPTTSDELATATKNTLELNTYFNSVYTITYASPTMTFDSADVGWTDGIVKRQGVFPGCIAPAGTEIQFITNIIGLSGEPNSSALLGAFYNLYQEAATPTALLTDNNFVLPQYSDAGPSLFYDVTLPNLSVDAVVCTSLLKYR